MKNAIIFIVLAAIVVAGVVYYESHIKTNTTPMEEQNPVTALDHDQLSAAATSTAPATEFTTASGVKIKVVEEGSGPAAKPGDRVTVNYVGMLPNGTQFDTSLQPGRTPFSFILANDNVIQGWHDGIEGMKAGGVRVLVIPPALGYGAMGNPPVIPANATLHFAIQLLQIGT